MNKNKNHRGITLVALIITIIVMLILVGVTINIALNGGLFGVTKEAVKQTEIAAYKEKIDAQRINMIMEQISKGLTGKEFMDKYEEELRNSKDLEGSIITRKDYETIRLITKEGYVFEITETETKHVGKNERPADLNTSNTEIKYNPSEWTNGKVKVTIETKIEGHKIEYQVDGGAWTEYKQEGFEVENNGTTINVRLKNGMGQVGGTLTGTVSNIDRLPPTVSISPNGGTYALPTTNGEVTGSATISTSITAVDHIETATDGISELKITKYAWSTDGINEPTSDADWADFESGKPVTKSDITSAGTWYLWTNVVDKAGNRAETTKVSGAFVVGGANEAANKITLTPSIQEGQWTNGTVEVEATYGSNLTQSSRTLECEGTEGEDGDYTIIDGNKVIVKTNGKMVKATAKDSEGNTVVATLTVFNIDSTVPEIELSENSNITWVQSRNVTVTLKDNESGLAEGAFVQYGWSTSNETAPTSYTKATLNYTKGAKTATFTASKNSGTGQYYLWVKPTTLKNVAGGSRSDVVISTGQFYIDAEAPTITASSSAVAGNSVSVTLKDTGSGLAGWYCSNEISDASSISSSDWIPVTGASATEPFKVTEATKYYIFAKDALDNVSEAFTISVSGAVWQNTDTEVYYDATYLAFNAAKSGETVKLVSNCTTKTQPIVSSNKSITADIGPYSMTVKVGPIKIESGATLTITGSGTITSSNSNTPTIENNGTLIVNSGTVKSTGYATITNYGKVTVNGGTISSTEDNAIWNFNSSHTTTSDPAVKITGGTITSSAGEPATISNWGNGMIYITGGTVSKTAGAGYVIYLKENYSGSVYVTSGGELISHQYGTNASGCIRKTSGNTGTVYPSSYL